MLSLPSSFKGANDPSINYVWVGLHLIRKRHVFVLESGCKKGGRGCDQRGHCANFGKHRSEVRKMD